jgi:hypothetical protein
MTVASTKRELVVSAGTAAPEVEELQALILSQLEAAYAEGSQRQEVQVAGPTNWWDVLAVGPFSAPFDLGFAKPNPIVRVGQPITFFSVLFLNPVMPPPAPALPSPLQIIGGALLPYILRYDATNVSTAQHVAAMSGVVNDTLTPAAFHVNAITLVPTTPGLYEVNLRAQILTAASTTMVPFAGYASRVDSINSSIFGPSGLLTRFEQPVRFDAYA